MPLLKKQSSVTKKLLQHKLYLVILKRQFNLFILEDNLSRDFRYQMLKYGISICKQRLTLGVGSLPNSTAIV